MAVRYRVDLESNTGVLLAQFQDYRSLNLSLNWNDISTHQLSISGFDSRISLFEKDSVIRVWVKDDEEGIIWTNLYNGLHKTSDQALFGNGNRSFVSYGYSFEGLLDGAYIAYKAGENSLARKSGSSSTVMYDYVRENIGSDATVANGRLSDHVTTGLSLAPDLANGGTWDGSRSYKKLLDVIREIAFYSREVGDAIDFQLSYLGNGNTMFQAGKIAIDRTVNGLDTTTGLNGAGNVPVVFSPLFGNVSEYRESFSRYNEQNTIFILGQGDGDERAVVVVEDGLSKTVSRWAIREGTFNATDDSLQDELDAVGLAVLRDRVADENINFTPRRGAQIWLRDYFLGDFVTGESFFTGQRFNKQIIGAKISIAPTDSGDVENISIDFADV